MGYDCINFLSLPFYLLSLSWNSAVRLTDMVIAVNYGHKIITTTTEKHTHTHTPVRDTQALSNENNRRNYRI